MLYRRALQPLLCRSFAEAQNISVRILDVEVFTCPRPLFETSNDACSFGRQLLRQRLDPAHHDVDVEVFILLAVRTVNNCLRRAFQMYREAVPADTRVKRFVNKVRRKAKFVPVILNSDW